MFNKIVIGIDGSEPSENALRLASDLAEKYGSEIHLVHTPQPETVAFALGAVAGYHAVATMPSEAEIKEAADKVIAKGEQIVTDGGQSVASVTTDRGDPAEIVVARAKDVGADLIVTGRRGLGNLGSLVWGSTSQRIGHLAETACLTVA